MSMGFKRNSYWCRLRRYFYETLTVFLLPDSILWRDQLCVYVNDGEPDPVFLWGAYCRRSARTSLHRGILSNYSLAVTSYTHYPGSRIKQGLINTFILHYTHTHKLAKEPGELLDTFLSSSLSLLSRTCCAQPGLNIEFFPFQQCCVETIQQNTNVSSFSFLFVQ